MDALRATVLARHRSIHAFCKASPDLKRATVYLVLAGRYPGDSSRQTARILEALGEPVPELAPQPAVPVERIAETLLTCKCARCRRPDRRGCRGCRLQTDREAAAVAALVEHFKADGSREL